MLLLASDGHQKIVQGGEVPPPPPPPLGFGGGGGGGTGGGGGGIGGGGGGSGAYSTQRCPTTPHFESTLVDL